MIEDSLQLQISLKTEDEIDNAALDFTSTAQEACWKSTPEVIFKNPRQNYVPQEIREIILEKRRLRRVWHTSRHPDDKRALTTVFNL